MSMKTLLPNTKTLLLYSLLVLAFAARAQAPFPAFPPANVTNNQDRNQMVWQLGITFPTLPPKLQDPNRPPGAYPSDSTNPQGNWQTSQGYFVSRSDFGLWTNYDDKPNGFWPGPEAWRVWDYPAIDLLRMKSGRAITTSDQWWTLRRPEIMKDLKEQLYGVMPADSVLPSVTFSTVTTTGGVGTSAYTQKAITGTIDISRYPQVRNRPQITATLRVPTNAVGKVPVIIVFNPGFGGLPALLDTYWNYVRPVGWGICIYSNAALQPDFNGGASLTSYLIGLVNKGNWRKPTDWGSLVAWSWGVSRLIDYFETDPSVDATKIGLTGHSRYGKATLVAMAFEPRLAIGYPSCAGSLGTKMNRRHWGQDIENSGWDQEYHWMAGAFFRWMGPKTPGTYLPRKIEDLTVDAHSLLAVCAPRPMFMNAGTQDTWPDPYGIYLTGIGASPVYQLLGRQGLIMNDPKPVIDQAYIIGDIGYRFHNGGHTDAPDWPAFLTFATRYLGTVTVLSTKTKNAMQYVKVYPNPTQDHLTVDLGANALHIKNIEVLDVTGRRTLQIPVTKVASILTLRNKLKPGVYVLKFQGDEVLTQRVVVE